MVTRCAGDCPEQHWDASAQPGDRVSQDQPGRCTRCPGLCRRARNPGLHQDRLWNCCRHRTCREGSPGRLCTLSSVSEDPILRLSSSPDTLHPMRIAACASRARTAFFSPVNAVFGLHSSLMCCLDMAKSSLGVLLETAVPSSTISRFCNEQ